MPKKIKRFRLFSQKTVNNCSQKRFLHYFASKSLFHTKKLSPSDLKTPEFEQYFYAKIPIFNEISHENRSVLFFLGRLAPVVDYSIFDQRFAESLQRLL